MASCLTPTEAWVSTDEEGTADQHVFIPIIQSSSNPGGCQYVVITGTEYDSFKNTASSTPSTVINPFTDLSPEQGTQIALSILAVWTVGLIARLIIKAIKQDGFESSYED